MPNILKSRLRSEIRKFFVARREELLHELAQIDELLQDDDATTLVGMPAFNVHGGRRPLVMRRRRPSPGPQH